MVAPVIAAAASAVIPKILDIGADLIDRLFPDPEEANKAKLELFKMQQDGRLAELEIYKQLDTAQMAINQQEAAHASIWVAGWRPAVGWGCVAGVYWNVMLQPFLSWLAEMAGKTPPPAADLELLLFLLSGMLGFGALRTFEKVRTAETA